MDFLRNCSDINERKDFEVENGQSATEVLESLSDAEVLKINSAPMLQIK